MCVAKGVKIQTSKPDSIKLVNTLYFHLNNVLKQTVEVIQQHVYVNNLKNLLLTPVSYQQYYKSRVSSLKLLRPNS